MIRIKTRTSKGIVYTLFDFHTNRWLTISRFGAGKSYTQEHDNFTIACENHLNAAANLK